MILKNLFKKNHSKSNYPIDDEIEEAIRGQAGYIEEDPSVFCAQDNVLRIPVEENKTWLGKLRLKFFN